MYVFKLVRIRLGRQLMHAYIYSNYEEEITPKLLLVTVPLIF